MPVYTRLLRLSRNRALAGLTIYYGTGIDKDHLARLHEVAVRKGIQEYEMFIDYCSSKYELQYRPFSIERVKE